MNNRVNIIAVILAVAVFVGIIVYSQSQKDSSVPEDVAETSDLPNEQVETTPPASPSQGGTTPATSPEPVAPSVVRPTVAAPVQPARPAQSEVKALGSEILIANAQMTALQTNSPSQYSMQVTKLAAAISALEINKSDGAQWVIMGEVAEDFGKSELAERAYLKSVEVDPARGGWNHLGTLYLARGAYFQAVWAYEGMVKARPDSEEAKTLLAQARELYDAR